MIKKILVHFIYLVVILFLLTKLNNTMEKVWNYRQKANHNMNQWSQCLLRHADTTYMKSKCDDALYDLRKWLRGHRCISKRILRKRKGVDI